MLETCSCGCRCHVVADNGAVRRGCSGFRESKAVGSRKQKYAEAVLFVPKALWRLTLAGVCVSLVYHVSLPPFLPPIIMTSLMFIVHSYSTAIEGCKAGGKEGEEEGLLQNSRDRQERHGARDQEGIQSEGTQVASRYDGPRKPGLCSWC